MLELPQSYYSNFSLPVPGTTGHIHVMFVTTKLDYPFPTGRDSQADSITHAIISSTGDPGLPYFVQRQAVGVTFGSIKDEFSLYKGRKAAFTRALGELTQRYLTMKQPALMSVVFNGLENGEQLDSIEHELAHAELLIDTAAKRFRAFMWEQFHKMFPDEETV